MMDAEVEKEAGLPPPVGDTQAEATSANDNNENNWKQRERLPDLCVVVLVG